LEEALTDGEDYELLFSITQSDYDKIKDETDITVVGYMTDEKEGQQLVTNDNQMIKLEAQGWDALKKRERDI